MTPKKLQIKAKESAGDESGLEEELRWAVDGFPRMQLSRPSAAAVISCAWTSAALPRLSPRLG